MAVALSAGVLWARYKSQGELCTSVEVQVINADSTSFVTPQGVLSDLEHQGLNFKGKIEKYSINYPTSNRSHIEFSANSGEDVYYFRIDVFNNGKSIIDIIAQDRDAISFDGEMIFK